MTTEIQYDFKQNTHTTAGADGALRVILGDRKIESFLDVGCGPGTWLAAAKRFGIHDVHGVDGIKPPPEDFRAPDAEFTQANLTRPFSLHRKFDLALCVEVAEHLPREASDVLIASLCAHSDLIAFSAASPSQAGEHHVTCEWPAYWQEKFNKQGFVCEDTIRWKIWANEEVEPWYRQNLFLARRDPTAAGKEPRIPAVINPAMFEMMISTAKYEAHRELRDSYFSGEARVLQYAALFFRAIRGKVLRGLRGTKPA